MSVTASTALHTLALLIYVTESARAGSPVTLVLMYLMDSTLLATSHNGSTVFASIPELLRILGRKFYNQVAN